MTISLMVSSWILDGFAIDTFGHALLAGLVVGVIDAVVWPAFAFLLVPLSVYTLGLANLAVNALVTWVVLDQVPGVRLDGFWTALFVAVITTTVATLLSSALALDDDSWYDQRIARRRRRRRGTTITDVPGVVFVQVDGLSEDALRFALASGDAPTLHRWLSDGSHRRTGWQTEWSSQTGVSQCGILHGSTIDMPAFRWVVKSTGELVVSNHPKSALEIERRHSDGQGLLAHNGSSYSNLFTGDAERAVLTMSVAGR
ncbi:MAG: phage holin family protein, partial [Acidobacteriota bacterium]